MTWWAVFSGVLHLEKQVGKSRLHACEQDLSEPIETIRGPNLNAEADYCRACLYRTYLDGRNDP